MMIWAKIYVPHLGSSNYSNAHNISERKNPHVYQMLCPGFAHPDFESYSLHLTTQPNRLGCIINLINTQHQMDTTYHTQTRRENPSHNKRIIYLLYGNCDDQESNPQYYRTHFAGFLVWRCCFWLLRWDEMQSRTNGPNPRSLWGTE